SELSTHETKAMTADVFLSVVRKYTRAKKLNERMLNELIERVEVFQTQKIDGFHVQRLRIHYHVIGAIEIPDIYPIPEIIIHTRKGVLVKYYPYQYAA
ncbi:MAG: DUF4368 domain-containing protein, partial [Oscillospiraceae bacterium]|nr:DUF4368 domain-containing protein [Oscillospiraceae bacterium]